MDTIVQLKLKLKYPTKEYFIDKYLPSYEKQKYI